VHRRQVGVLALQGDVAEHVAALERAGAEAVLVRRREHLVGVNGLVIPGGESTTIAQLAADYGLVAPIRALVAAGTPVWGTCAGLILLADRTDGTPAGFGGLDAEVRRNAFGRQVDSFEVDLTIRGLTPEPFRAVFIRSPVVTSVGPGVEILARLDDGGIVAVRQQGILGTAFHPELTGDDRLHRLFLDLT
jgi:pyridoxal 5'-phosphate synthase pdxT subunit